MNEYKLDKTVSKKMTHKEAEMQNVFADDVPYAERLRQAYYLISIAYGFDIDNAPRLDRTVFSSESTKFNIKLTSKK